MKKVFSTFACISLVLVCAAAQANTITGTGHIYSSNGSDGIDDWYFNVSNVQNTSRVWITLDVNYTSGTDFDSYMYLFTDNYAGLNSTGNQKETLIAQNDDQDFPLDLSSYIQQRVNDSSNYQIRISEFDFPNGWATSNLNNVQGDWYYSISVCSDSATLSWNNQSSPVPEPTTMLLFGAGLVSLTAIGRRKIS